MQLTLDFFRSAVLCAGAQAAEDELVAEVTRLHDAARRDLGLLAEPVRVIVPSRSLRLHVAGVLAERCGPHLLGVVVQTLHGVAQELVGEAGGTDGTLQDVLAFRQAMAAPTLAELVVEYEGARGPVVDTMRELFEAGLREGHVDAALDALAEAQDLAPGERARAEAVVEAAGTVAPLVERLGLRTAQRQLELAATRLGREPTALRARAVLLHGFADATGVAADFLERLAGLSGARFFAVVPPDPAEPDQVDASARFGLRLRERLRAPATVRRWSATASLTTFTADGEDAEALEVARRIVALLDAGVVPERIGVVARDVDRRVPGLRRHFERLGVPCSAIDVAGPDTPEARWRSLAELVREGARFTTDRWLDLVGAFGDVALDAPARAALRLGLRALGAARVAQVAALDPRRILRGLDGMPLPGGSGLDGPRLSRRSLPAVHLQGAIDAAAGFVRWCDALPSRALPADWAALLAELLGTLLGQPPEHPARVAVAPLGELPPLSLDREELGLVLDALLDGLGRGGFGGKGGGVGVFGIREARGRTFAHLFLLGTNRRTTQPRDAVLSEPVRFALRAVLPDLPLRRDRFDEDRFHFGWLLSAAPQVTVSWLTTDARGKLQSVSPLLERLRWAGRWTKAEPARPLHPPELPPVTTARERATIAALHGGPEALGPHLANAWALEGAADAAGLAAAQVRVLVEKDLARPVPGPYQGWLGPPRPDDVRNRDLYVSRVEDLVACPWQTLLQAFLGAEPVPDPLAEVPTADARLAGILVHEVLEAVARRKGAGTGRLDQVRVADAGPVPWPGDDELRALVHDEAARLLEREGIRLPGLEALLAIRVAPYLAAARDADWRDGGPTVAGAEVQGSFEVDGRRVWFRADRLDVVDEFYRFTDYKTGSPPKSTADARGALLGAVEHGRNLQAAAYAHADGVHGAGRYLYLAPKAQPRSLTVAADDAAFASALDRVLRVVFAALDAGVFFPRLVEPGDDRQPRRCATCRVAEACLAGESGDRRRLRALAEAPPTDPAGRAFSDLWRVYGRKG